MRSTPHSHCTVMFKCRRSPFSKIDSFMKCSVHHWFFQIFSGFGFPAFSSLKAAHKIPRMDLILIKNFIKCVDSRVKLLFLHYFPGDSILAQTILYSASRSSTSEPWLPVLPEVSPFPGSGHSPHLAMRLALSQGFFLLQHRRILAFLETEPLSKSQAPNI